MYKPKPEQKNTNRLRLDIESKLPSLYTVEAQLNEAKGRRGCLVELPWQGLKPMQLWILGVEWQSNGDGPVWSLYEQYGSESKMHWSNPYAPGDIPIMYDVVCMSTMGDPITKPSEPPPAPPPPPPPPPPPEPTPPVQPQLPPGYPYPMPPYPMPGYPPMDPNAPMPGYPPMDPNMAAQYGYPPPYYPGQPYPVPPQGWPQYPPQPGTPGASYPPGNLYPPGAAPQAVPAPVAPEPSTSPSTTHSKLSVDYNLVSKRAKIQLGSLLLESTLIAEVTLDAALKLQSMVEEGLCSPEQAAKGLFKFHTKGQAIGEYLPEFDAVVLPPRQKKTGQVGAQPQGGALTKAALDLLVKAGVLQDSDIKAALAARAKVGGDVPSLLTSAGKLEKKTYQAAVICLPMIREGFLKLEQCVIALNYCAKSKVDFDTALEEMGWQNPRKLRKDLFGG